MIFLRVGKRSWNSLKVLTVPFYSDPSHAVQRLRHHNIGRDRDSWSKGECYSTTEAKGCAYLRRVQIRSEP